ncbi:hypothetical protein FDB24_11365 [Clostridium botulinum]|uniref:rolling circle replication-associated protein n=1 Tax=Clostridium botulinum TaxID=1491 RepID=UPI00077312DD|nr:hypothetical protein [Clostridium botulinum]NFL86825.1 hypothetical protein [Clostridium botulinum]NFO21851.1 hypothetical protein [Clostridium botulinum]
MKLYDRYGYEEVYNKDLNLLSEESKEDRIESLRKNDRYSYVVKTITSGDIVESEIYPTWKNRNDMPRGKRKNKQRAAQKNLNDKNTKKKIVRLVNTNFTNNDVMVTLTYDDKHLPNEEEARKDIQNYIRKLRRYRRKEGLSELKYIYVIEFKKEEEKSKKIRVHHHMIINKMDRDIIEKLWGKGYANAKRLQSDEFGLEGMARYIAKDLKGSRRWSASRNLKQPKITVSKTRLTKRKIENMIKNENSFKGIFENTYKGCKYNDCKVMYSEINGGFYLHARLIKNNS